MYFDDQSRRDGVIKQLWATPFEVVPQTLLAASHCEKFAVQRLVPMPVEPQFSEGMVVGNTLPEAFRLRDRAVEIQQETAEFAAHAKDLMARVRRIFSPAAAGDVGLVV